MSFLPVNRWLGVDIAKEARHLLQRDSDTLPSYPLDLDEPFLYIGQHNSIPTRQIFAHTLALGRSGSGKTSAILTAWTASAMQKGWGMCACTFKSSDTSLVVDLAHRCGRQDSLIVVSPGGPWVANLLAGHDPAGVADLLMEAANNREEGGHRKESDAIWMGSVRHLIRLAAQTLQAAALPVTLKNLKACIDTIPTVAPTGDLLWPEEDALLRMALQRAQNNPQADPDQVRECLLYFTRELQRPGSSRFVSSVLATWSNSFDFCLAPGPVRDTLFSDRQPTFTPNLSRQGVIIVLDMPESTYGTPGRDAQLVFKAAWINAMLRTQGLASPLARPVAFICDEYQRLCTPLDAKMFEAGRSSLVAALCLTQSIPNLAKAFAASQAGEHAVQALVSSFANLICCQNHCPVTNQKIADIIAKDRTLRHSGGTTDNDTWQEGTSSGSSSGGGSGPGGGQSSWNASNQTSSGRSLSSGSNTGWREEIDFRLQPLAFQNLRTSSPPHYMVDAILYASGHRFANGMPFTGASFPQRYLPREYRPARKAWLWHS